MRGRANRRKERRTREVEQGLVEVKRLKEGEEEGGEREEEDGEDVRTESRGGGGSGRGS